MRLISVLDIEPNMVLGKSIFSKNNKLLLGAGFRITPDFKGKLTDRGYNHVYVMEEGTDDVIPEDIISHEIKQQAQNKLHDAADQITSLLKVQGLSRNKLYDLIQSGYLKDFDITYDMKKIASDILDDMMKATLLNSLMFKTKKSYYMDHALNTTVISILLGKKYRFTKDELMSLAVGTFLHDFGKIIIERLAEAQQKSADELMREHPTFGYLLIQKSSGSTPMICQIINQHHEQQDGNGYPIGLTGENLPPITNINIQRNARGSIFRLAEICSVADAYDNLVMNPTKEKQLSPGEAIKILIEKSGSVYNKHIVGTLTKIVPIFPVGAMVKIIHILDPALIGYSAVIAKVNEEHLDRPVIILLYDRSKRRVKPRIIDTSKLQKVNLELVI
ncbi:HD-GYP domain-containing protein [Candidatus Latescibacterota bacterium]